MQLRECVVMVTGSSSGIGKETAKAFASRGCRLAVTYKEGKAAGEEVRRECAGYAPAILLELDVRDQASVERAVVDVLKEFGHLDVLVNCAGIMVREPLAKQSVANVEDQVAVNLTGLMCMTRAVLPVMAKQRRGIVINVASGAGQQGFAGLTVYCATKFGVRGFTQSLALEAPKGVRTYAICPGQTATRMTGFKGDPPEKVAHVILLAGEESLGKTSGDDVNVWEYI